MASMTHRQYYFSIFIVALFATLGSLFFSEVMNFTPCTLCWYQRIFMYPIAILYGLAIYRDESIIQAYGFFFSVLGWLFALYHLLVYWGLVPQEIIPCSEESSCTTTYIQWLGFITIPMLSFAAFGILTGLHAKLYFLERKRL